MNAPLNRQTKQLRGRGPGACTTARLSALFGILRRNGLVRVFPVQARTGKEVIARVQRRTKPGSLYYPDDWQAQASLRVRGDHIVVRKEQGRPRGRDHINSIEGCWSHAKHRLYP